MSIFIHKIFLIQHTFKTLLLKACVFLYSLVESWCISAIKQMYLPKRIPCLRVLFTSVKWLQSQSFWANPTNWNLHWPTGILLIFARVKLNQVKRSKIGWRGASCRLTTFHKDFNIFSTFMLIHSHHPHSCCICLIF